MWMVGLFIETGKNGMRGPFGHTEFERPIGHPNGIPTRQLVGMVI